MRKRTKMTGLIMHITPEGKLYSSSENKCRMSLRRLEKLVENGFRAAGACKKQEEEYKIVMFWGRPMKLTIQEYNEHWIPAFGE